MNHHALQHKKYATSPTRLPVSVRHNTTISKLIQPKLTIGAPNDKYEQEADHVADQVMRMPSDQQQIQRQSSDEMDEELVTLSASNLLSRKAETGLPSMNSVGNTSQINQLTGRSGQSMDKSTQSFMESRFGQRFDHVRIHTDQAAEESSKAIQAKAYTIGNHVAFAQGQYNPSSYEGKKLLAHELTHVIQQQSNTIRRVCDCDQSGGRRASAKEHKLLASAFPNLIKDDYCITHEKTNQYNCIAWSVMDQTQWVWNQVDTVYGDNDGRVSVEDFDSYYLSTSGFTPTLAPSSNTQVALFGLGNTPTHAAKVEDSSSCGTVPFSSKLGEAWQISHDLNQLEGGSVYGNVIRYYGI